MVIGHGDIASVLPDQDDLLFFASGVSNSQETRESQYEREVNLLLEQDPTSHLVYFSSLSVFYGVTRYIDHKRTMEHIVDREFDKSTIVRIGNITWGDNPHTLINHLKANPEAEIRDEYRYLVDKPEFLHWIGMIPVWSCQMNVPGRRLKVQQIVDEIKEGKL